MTKLCVCFIFDRLGLVIFLILLAGCFSFWRYRYQQSLVVQSCNHTGYAPFVQSASTQNIPAHLVSIPGDVSTHPTQLHQGLNSMVIVWQLVDTTSGRTVVLWVLNVNSSCQLKTINPQRSNTLAITR